MVKPQAEFTRVPAAEINTHLESACTSHRGAAAGLLDQTEPHGGVVTEASTCTCKFIMLVVETSTHLASVCTSQREAAASLLDQQSELHGGSLVEANTCRCLVEAACVLHPSTTGRDEHAPRVRQHHPRTMEQLQACCRSCIVALLLMQTVTRAWSWCWRQRRARSPSAPRTVEQPQACWISRSLMAALRQRHTHADAWSKPQAECT